MAADAPHLSLRAPRLPARAAMTLIPAPAAAPARCFSWWKETGMDGRTVRYLVRDQDGNHVATCSLEAGAQDLIDLLNFALRAETHIDALEAPLIGLRDEIARFVFVTDPSGKARVDGLINDAWTAIGRIRGAL